MFRNWRRPDHTNLCSHEHRAGQRRHISDHGWYRTRPRVPIHRDGHPAGCVSAHLPRYRMMLRWRCRAPKSAPRVGSDRTSGYGLENQSWDRRWSRRRPTAVLTGIGTSEPPLPNARCTARSVAPTMRSRSCPSELMRAAHCRPMRRRKLKEYRSLIRSTSLTGSHMPRIPALDRNSFRDCEPS
jgi:hypothetical protein